jgi:hypothetical protein
MENESEIAVLGRRGAELESFEVIIFGIKPGAPRFERKRRVRDDEVELLQPAVGFFEIRGREDVVLPDVVRRRRTVVQDHVHFRQRRGGIIHLLAVERQINSGRAPSLIVRLEQQRPGAAGGIVDGLAPTLGPADLNHFRHDPGNFRRSVELALALPGLGGEIPHQVFVCVAQEIVTLGAIAAKEAACYRLRNEKRPGNY